MGTLDLVADYKVHMASTSGYWPCGATDPRLTSEDPNEVTCVLCKKNRDWSAAHRQEIDAAIAYLDAGDRLD